MSSLDTNPLLEDAWQRCDDAIERGFASESPVLVDALPAMGKSSGVIRWAAKTGNPVAVFTERHKLYNQYTKWAEEHGLTVHRIPSFYRDCPTAKKKPEHGDEWKKKFMTEYRRGRSATSLHKYATKYFDGSLPCQKDGQCEYMRRLETPLEDQDVLVGNFKHAHKAEYIEGRSAVFDEFPGNALLDEYSSDHFTETISSYITHIDQLPYHDWDDLNDSHDPKNQPQSVQDWLDDTSDKYYETLALVDRDTSLNMLAPVFTRIALTWERLDNRWRRVELEDGYIAVRNSKNHRVYILHRPDLDDAESVLALDGTPSLKRWRVVLGDDLEHNPVLSESEKREYLTDVLGLRIIQATDDEKPYLSGEHVNPKKDMAFIEAVVNQEGGEFGLITSKEALGEYRIRGLNELIPEDHQMYYGDVRGTNDFEKVRFGLVVGSPHPSDRRIQMWGAFAGKSIPVERKGGRKVNYGRYGNSLLYSIRENGVLQAIMRFGRIEADGERGATVYVHTGAIPTWVEPERCMTSFMMWDTRGTSQVIETIKTLNDWRHTEFTTTELRSAMDEQEYESPIGYDRVLRVLHDLSERGYLESEKIERNLVWKNSGLEAAGRFGHVTFAC